jgi:hypothetical protein
MLLWNFQNNRWNPWEHGMRGHRANDGHLGHLWIVEGLTQSTPMLGVRSA